MIVNGSPKKYDALNAVPRRAAFYVFSCSPSAALKYRAFIFIEIVFIIARLLVVPTVRLC